MAQDILLVEDDRAIATVICAALEDEGFSVRHCTGIAARDRALKEQAFAVMLTDVRLGDGDGIESLDAVKTAHPDMPVVVLSAQNTLDTAVRATGSGAFEYFPKPFDVEELVLAIRQAANRNDADDAQPGEDATQLPLIGRSKPMQDVFRMITRVLPNDLSVLVLGESGTGKELVAEAIHGLGARKTGPFVAVNTAAIPHELIESELFGHEKGAFTGAVARNIGKFEQADGGTLFLDEIGDMSAAAQTRLLRALQTGRFRRVGGREEIAVDVRVISATNRDLAPLIASGEFREDLYYRLNVVPIHLPPLREREGDIADLARHFLVAAAAEGLPLCRVGDDAIELLECQEWPGNVRQLRNVIFRAALLSRDTQIDRDAIFPLLDTPPGKSHFQSGERDGPAGFTHSVRQFLHESRPADGDVYQEALAAFERPLIETILQRTKGNQLKAAQVLGINRNTLRKKLTDLRIEPEKHS